MKNKRKRNDNTLEDIHESDKQKRCHKREIDDDFDDWESWEDDSSSFRDSYSSEY